jgi:osmoprotectant transport system ATP-binding protein
VVQERSLSETLRFENVSVQTESARLVENLSFSVQSGQVMVLLGRSGSGKTTTLKLVNNLLKPSEGRVLVEGKSTNQWDPIELRRRIGYVIQETGLFPHFTIRRNVGLVPSLLNWDPARIESRVREVMALVGLEMDQMADRYPHQLSGGQRQRAGVARALAADPPILLMDEPFGALDPLTRAEIQTEFKSLQQRLSKTVLFVTHDVTEALMLADRIGLMEQGRLIESGTREQFKESKHPLAQSYLNLAAARWA